MARLAALSSALFSSSLGCKGGIGMNRKWVKAAGIRAVKTMAQTAVTMLSTAVTIAQVDWVTVAITAALAGVVSILTSIAGLLKVGEEQ